MKKYSDLPKMKKYSDLAGYNRHMSFLENLENSLDFPRDGEQNWALKLFKDQCCESCLCKSERDHESNK